MVQSWLILSPFVLVPGTLDEQRFQGAHFLCGIEGCFVSMCEMALQQLQWPLPILGSMCLERMNQVPQLRPKTSDCSRWLVSISEASEGSVERWA